MNPQAPSKVSASHLGRNAYLYVRQSTLRQVVENTESTQRQYALRQRALALGWKADQILVIDSDLGRSGASAEGRTGFGELVAEVGVGRAGIVLGLEVSRLARNNADWHRLLEICALTDTLILDEDGVYDPAHYNDRLLLGLKGTMSEAELHVLRARLRGGILSKAARGELRIPLPIGFVYDAAGRVVLDPDAQIQESVRLLFETFARIGTACSTVKHFHQNELLFPKRITRGPRKGEVVWEQLGLFRALSILHNPRFAGAYVYGRRTHRQRPDGRQQVVMKARDEWLVLLLDAHPGYISWEEYERNEERLRETALAYGADRRHGPAREGPALLQGLAVCGICGARMSVRYHSRGEKLAPDYDCLHKTMDHVQPRCQRIPGASIDAAVGRLLVELVTPEALELSLAVQDEIAAQLEQADRLRHQRVERAEYEAELARSRFMQVDPSNRLVADSLEAEWNERLRALESAREEYERGRAEDQQRFDRLQRERIRALANDFPSLWNDPATPYRERKRIAALLIEDVTLVKRDVITAHVRFRGGRAQTLSIPIPLNAWQLRATERRVLVEMDRLLDEHTDGEVAAILRERGMRTGAGDPFTSTGVKWLRYSAGLKSLRERLRAKGMLTSDEMARRHGVTAGTVRAWAREGLIAGRRTNDKGAWLFEPNGVNPTHSARSAQPTRQEGPNPVATDSTAGGAV
jgi:DNA invertase Pin-like site-specific DNA recombinase